jgi:hypothetical protein
VSVIGFLDHALPPGDPLAGPEPLPSAGCQSRPDQKSTQRWWHVA